MKNERLYLELEKNGCSAAILCLPENVVHASGFITLPPIYAVGFFAFSMPLATVIINVRERKEVLYIADSVQGDVRRLSFIGDVRTYSPYSMTFETDPVRAYLDGLSEIAAEIIPSDATVGVEAAGFSYFAQDALRQVLPKVRILDVTRAIYRSKMVKAPWEIERMRRAAAIIDAAMAEFVQGAKAGRNELDIWKDIFGAMNRQGGEHSLISGELVTGPRSISSPYPGGPHDRVTELGDVGIMDMSVRVDGYWCDCCNIVSYGQRNAKQEKYFEIIRNAYEAAVAALKPGAVCSDVYARAAHAYEEKGFECPHYIGHSIGSGLNDLPKIIPCDHTVVEEGMCFSLEPGIYKEDMGLRIEKMVYITADSCKIFNRFAWGVKQV